MEKRGGKKNEKDGQKIKFKKKEKKRKKRDKRKKRKLSCQKQKPMIPSFVAHSSYTNQGKLKYIFSEDIRPLFLKYCEIGWYNHMLNSVSNSSKTKIWGKIFIRTGQSEKRIWVFISMKRKTTI